MDQAENGCVLILHYTTVNVLLPFTGLLFE